MSDDHRLVKEINQIYHELESPDYDAKHCEILEGDREWWDALGRGLFRAPTDAELPPMRLLDLGSGTGFAGGVLLPHLRSGDSLVCYDYSLAMLKASKDKFSSAPPGRVSLISGDAERLPFRSASFGAVAVNAVLHHLPDYARCLREMDRILVPGGLLVIAHEQNKSFFRSRIFSALAVLYKLAGGNIPISDAVCDEVNRRLKEKNLIRGSLGKDEIVRRVDYHSPIEQSAFGIDRDKGFVPEEITGLHLKGYRVVERREYSTFFHRPFLKSNPLLRGLLRLFNRVVLRNRGPLFSLVLRKPLQEM